MTLRPVLRLMTALAALAAAAALTVRWVDLRTDLGFFLPRDAPAAIRPLLEGLRDGPGAGLILAGISGAPGPDLVRASDALARTLEESGQFRLVFNGRPRLPEAEVALLLHWRYILDPPVTAEEFTAAALRRDLEEGLRVLGGYSAPLTQRLLPADPTGRLRRIIAGWTAGTGNAGPSRSAGAWLSRDGSRALLLARARAAGFDLAGQRGRALGALRSAFAGIGAGSTMRLDLAGPSVFAVETSARIEDESWRLTLASCALTAAILILAFRAPSLLAALAVPPLAGIIAGAAAVQAIFGQVHGVALTFGGTLIGIGVDYPLLLAGNIRPGMPPRMAARQIWPTLLMAGLTAMAGFVPMVLSGFPGLSQLGVLSIAGLAAALLLTRWMMPALLPPDLALPPSGRLSTLANALPRLRLPLLALLGLAAAGVLGPGLGGIAWQNDLGRLSPIPEAARQLDRELRTEIGAPDVRLLLVVDGASAEAVLERSETVAAGLRGLVAEGVIAGFDLAAHYLPSLPSQAARRAALPEPEALRAALDAAKARLPFREGLFAPFLADVEAARTGPPLSLEDVHASGLGWRVESLLSASGGRWAGLIVPAGVADAGRLARFAADQGDDVQFVDLKAEAERLVARYRDEALASVGWGAAVALLVLVAGLRRPGRVLQVAAPVGLAVLATLASLAALGVELSLFHLVSLFLVAGVGLDYALFFNRYSTGREERARTLRALVLCNATTVSVFAVMACSDLPVLAGIGLTVALGAALSLLISGAFAAAATHPQRP